MNQDNSIGLATLILVILAWFAFGAIFLFRRKPRQTEEVKRAPVSILGIGLQSVSFALISSLPRSYWWPFHRLLLGELALCSVAAILAYGSCWFCLNAVQTLGKQWTYAARVINGHELITCGPYGIVRNPIYLGMFGLMLATGLTLSRWWALVGGVAIFLIGTGVRIRAEERLLRETFGPQFDEYARRVPAFFPRF